jgi:uncharacterized protein
MQDSTGTNASNTTSASGKHKVMDQETLDFALRIFQLVRAGDAATLTPLLDRGVPPNLRNEKGDSLLMLACYHGHFDAAKALLEHGADPELHNDQGQTPLAGAAYQGDLRVVQLLLDHGANVEGAAPGGKTALMLAAMFNRTAVLDLLIERGANILARDASGLTALDAARIMGANDTAARLARSMQ